MIIQMEIVHCAGIDIKRVEEIHHMCHSVCEKSKKPVRWIRPIIKLENVCSRVI